MKKRIALIVACLFLMSSAAFASPLTDYKAGKASIDLNYRWSKNSLDAHGYGNFGLKGRGNFEPSVTVGIADKWALQYRNVNSKSKDTLLPEGDIGNLRLSANEFNVLYSLTPQVSAFVGYVGTKTTSHTGFDGSESIKRNTWQLGLLGTVPIAEKVSAYSVLGAGNKWVNFEIGLSYAFTPNWELNLDYRYIKAKDFQSEAGGIFDVKTKGFGLGVTYKFQ